MVFDIQLDKITHSMPSFCSGLVLLHDRFLDEPKQLSIFVINCHFHTVELRAKFSHDSLKVKNTLVGDSGVDFKRKSSNSGLLLCE